jgi:hypothetical protein
VPASGEFKLSISKALTDQLHDSLQHLEPAPLTVENVSAVEARGGVYQLYRGDELVYIGSAAGSLRTRLRQHMRKLSGRQNIEAADVSFSCLYVDEDLTVLAPEDRLIRLFRDEGSSAWNGNGFGPHDPGRNRDFTALAADHFDRGYPIRLDWRCEVSAGSYGAKELLGRLKKQLPYTLRYELSSADHARPVEVPEGDMSARQLLELIARALPAYQVTALGGYVIMYKESVRYPEGETIKR